MIIFMAALFSIGMGLLTGIIVNTIISTTNWNRLLVLAIAILVDLAIIITLVFLP